MKELYRHENVLKEEVVAVGDSVNDIPMLKEVGLPLIIGNRIKVEGARYFNSIEEVLEYIDDEVHINV